MSLITKSVYLRGPKGERGLQGLKGERGLAGAQGLPGPAGQPDPQFIRNQISATGNITYNQATGVIGFTNPGYATTTYVDTAIANLVSGAPDVLNTLNELAAAIGDNADFINSVIVKTGGIMTGALILNADPITNLGAATKQYVDQATSSIVTSYNDLTDKPTLFSGSYTDLTSKPSLATVATSGSYNDLTNKPTLFSGVYADLTSKPTLFDGAYSSLSGKPSLATVATSGSYNDLTNKPIVSSFDQSLNTTNNVTFNSVTATSIDVENLEFTGTGPIVISSGNDLKFTSAGDITFNGSKLSTVAISGSYTDLSGKPNLATVATSGSYNDLTNKPTLFSGSYTGLTDKPTIPTDINQLSDVSGLLEAEIQSYNYDATAGQLIFTGQGQNQQALSYTDYNFVQVFKNGVLLRRNIQYTLNDGGYVDYVATGDSIELNSPASLDDWIYIIVTNTTGSNQEFTTDGGAYADVMLPGLDGGSY